MVRNIGVGATRNVASYLGLSFILLLSSLVAWPRSADAQQWVSHTKTDLMTDDDRSYARIQVELDILTHPSLTVQCVPSEPGYQIVVDMDKYIGDMSSESFNGFVPYWFRSSSGVLQPDPGGLWVPGFPGYYSGQALPDGNGFVVRAGQGSRVLSVLQRDIAFEAVDYNRQRHQVLFPGTGAKNALKSLPCLASKQF